MARPEGARIVRASGEVIPCELAPLGVDDEGCDVWAVATALGVGDRLTVENFPPMTGIVGPISQDAAEAMQSSGEFPFLIVPPPPSRIERLVLGRRFNRFMVIFCAVMLVINAHTAVRHFGMLGGSWHPALAVLDLLGATWMAAVLPGFWRRGWRQQ